MTTLIVVRHGQTAWNATGRFQGQADPPLDAVGRRQARAAAVALATYAPTRIVSSDLVRARQTADAIASHVALPVAVDRRLREVALGGWQGLDRRSAAHQFPDEYAAWIAGDDVRRGGGETEDEAGRRVAAVLAELAVGDGTVVVVSHGLALRAGLRLLAPDDAAHLRNGRWVVVTRSADPLLSV